MKVHKRESISASVDPKGNVVLSWMSGCDSGGLAIYKRLELQPEDAREMERQLAAALDKAARLSAGDHQTDKEYGNRYGRQEDGG